MSSFDRFDPNLPKSIYLLFATVALKGQVEE